jgi:hypothetical protein
LSPSFENKIFQRLRDGNERKIAALFIGNIDADYNNEKTKALFSINTRRETFSAVAEITQKALYMPKTLEDFLEKIRSGALKNKIVLLNINDFRIPNTLWFDILLETDFFIYMCGYIQPYCHNQIESMLAGCIPVTQFRRFFIPSFEHEKTALLFDTFDELKKLLVEIAEGKYNAKKTLMRKNISAYYWDNYSFKSFEDKLTALLSGGVQQSTYHIATGEEHILKELEKQN